MKGPEGFVQAVPGSTAVRTQTHAAGETWRHSWADGSSMDADHRDASRGIALDAPRSQLTHGISGRTRKSKGHSAFAIAQAA